MAFFNIRDKDGKIIQRINLDENKPVSFNGRKITQTTTSTRTQAPTVREIQQIGSQELRKQAAAGNAGAAQELETRNRIQKELQVSLTDEAFANLDRARLAELEKGQETRQFLASESARIESERIKKETGVSEIKPPIRLGNTGATGTFGRSKIIDYNVNPVKGKITSPEKADLPPERLMFARKFEIPTPQEFEAGFKPESKIGIAFKEQILGFQEFGFGAASFYADLKLSAKYAVAEPSQFVRQFVKKENYLAIGEQLRTQPGVFFGSVTAQAALGLGISAGLGAGLKFFSKAKIATVSNTKGFGFRTKTGIKGQTFSNIEATLKTPGRKAVNVNVLADTSFVTSDLGMSFKGQIFGTNAEILTKYIGTGTAPVKAKGFQIIKTKGLVEISPQIRPFKANTAIRQSFTVNFPSGAEKTFSNFAGTTNLRGFTKFNLGNVAEVGYGTAEFTILPSTKPIITRTIGSSAGSSGGGSQITKNLLKFDTGGTAQVGATQSATKALTQYLKTTVKAPSGSGQIAGFSAGITTSLPKLQSRTKTAPVSQSFSINALKMDFFPSVRTELKSETISITSLFPKTSQRSILDTRLESKTKTKQKQESSLINRIGLDSATSLKSITGTRIIQAQSSTTALRSLQVPQQRSILKAPSSMFPGMFPGTPGVPISFGFPSRKSTKKARTPGFFGKQPKQYQPSITAKLFNIRGTPLKISTGFGIRPIEKKTKKKKKKSTSFKYFF